MLNKKDLQLVKCDLDTFRLLFSGTLSEVFEIVDEWFKTPELKPISSSIENYMNLTKEQILRRIINIDWSNGLHACQISQLKLRQFQKSQRLHWRAIRLSNGKDNIRLNLDVENIKSRMESYLSHFFYCYVYAEHHKDSDTFLYSLSIVPKDKDKQLYANMRFGFMIYFPETELIVTHSSVWIREYDLYFKEALLDTFSAITLKSEPIQVKSIKSIKELALYKHSDNVFSGLNNDGLDTNPLDIRQKRPKGFDQSYVKTSESRKRIVPIDMDEMKERYSIMKENFAWNEVSGHKILNVDLKLPLVCNDTIVENEYDDDVIEISITMEGLNVAEGIKESIEQGLIKVPAPVWLESIGISGAKNLSVTSDGVFNIEEDKIEPPIYKKNPMF